LFNKTIAFLLLSLLPSLSFGQPEVFEMAETFRLPDVGEESRIQYVNIHDFGDDGIDEIICDIWHNENSNSRMGIYRNDDWVYYSDPVSGQILDIIVCDLNRDGYQDIAFKTTTRENDFWVYLGPDFAEILNYHQSYFGRDPVAAGDRILLNGESIPFIVMSWPSNKYNWGGVIGGYRNRYKYYTIWESSWLTDYPRRIASICRPYSFIVRESENNGSEYFAAGNINHSYMFVNRDRSIDVEGDDRLYLLFSSHGRPFNQPDSLHITTYPAIEMIDGRRVSYFHRFGSCKKSAVDDFNNDGRLEWAQAYWERIGMERNFEIHLGIFYPDSMVLAREFIDTLRNPFFADNVGSYLIKGTSAMDINDDGEKEILLAIQNRPVYIIDSQTMEVMMQSDVRVHNNHFFTFEVGHFDNSGRLQVLMIIPEEKEYVIYNLPERWEE